MNQKLYYLITFFILIIQSKAIACSPSLEGPSSIQPNCSSTYKVDPFLDCLISIETVSYLTNNVIASAVINGNKVVVTNNNMTTTNQDVSILVTYYYFDKCNSKKLRQGSVKKTINFIGRPGIPDSPTIVQVSNGTGYKVSTNSVNATSYMWNVNNGYVSGTSTSNSVIINPTSSCGITVTGTVTAQNGCNASSVKRSFTINTVSSAPAKPYITGPSTIQGDSYAHYYAGGNQYASPTAHEWDVNYTQGTLIYYSSGGNLLIDNRVDDGNTYLPNFRVRVQNSCGWSSWSDTKRISLLSGKVGGGGGPELRTVTTTQDQSDKITTNLDSNGNELFIYPNSTRDILNFSKSFNTLKNEGYTHVKLTDLRGIKIIFKAINTLESNQLQLSNLQTGQYILTVYGDNVKAFKTKVIKE